LWWFILAGHLYVHSCSIFFRRRVFSDGFFFNQNLRAFGDAEFMVRVLRAGYRFVHMRQFIAAFTFTGKNMSKGNNARLESERFLRCAPIWLRANRVPVNLLRLLTKALSGAYFQKYPIRYSIYTEDNLNVRKRFEFKSASFRWKVKL